MKRRALLAAVPAALVAGCATPQVDRYAAEKPVLDLRRYFDGPVKAWGVFTDRSGEVVKRFTVDLVGRWQGDEGELDERFLYSDGTRQRRVWRLSREPDGRWRGRADDVVGEAIGQASGNALRWQYTLRIPVGDHEWDVQMDDWMFLVDDQVMLNRATMSKFGVRVGEVALSFRKP